MSDNDPSTALLQALGIPRQAEPEDCWQDEALCAQVDPEIFFPEKGGSTKNAKEVCASCPVRFECLEYALNEDLDTGVYGGLSSNERRPLHRAHRALLRAMRPEPVVVDVPPDRMLAARRANVKKAQQASIAARAKRAAS
jgi:WhiB family redox-sensing transcriptional regulator